MKQFTVVFTGTPETSAKKWGGLDEAAKKQREQQGMAAWQEWAKKYEKAVVFAGSPLGKTKKINEKGITDIKNELVAFVVIKAESHDAAAKMFLNHPHFAIFPGDAVEVMECLPIPTR